MKKVFVFFLFVGITVSHGQVKMGIKAGYNLSRVTGDWNALLEDFLNVNLEAFNILPQFEPRFKSGYQAGMFAEATLSDNFFIQPEIYYSLKGVNFKDKFDFEGEFNGSFVTVDGDYTYNQTYSYLEIPVLIKYKSKGGFNLFAGPYVAFLLASKGDVLIEANISTNIFGFPFSGPQEFNQSGLEKENFKTIDFGIAAGLGYEFPVGLAIDARFVKGMINISADLDNEMFSTGSIQIGLSYTLVQLSKKE